MPNKIKAGMLKLTEGAKKKFRPLTPWEKNIRSIATTVLPKCVLDSQLRQMTLADLKRLTDSGVRLDG